MDIRAVAKSGTLESNDIMIMVGPSENGKINIEVNSIVEKQFGDEIRNTIKETLEKLNVTSVNLKAEDKGALEYTIRARIEVAIKRSLERED